MSDVIRTRKGHCAGFKARVALKAVRESKTLNEFRQEFGVHPVQVSQWKKELLQRAGERFESKRGFPIVDPEHQIHLNHCVLQK